MYLIIFYALVTSLGIVGVGHFIWARLREESGHFSQKPAVSQDFTENFFLNTTVSWFMGYFCYEGLLNIFSLLHIFHPIIITLLGLALTLFGIAWILRQRNILAASFKASSKPGWEIGALILLAGFLLFWNLYPAFDVDSCAFYFTTVQNLLLHGGREFSAFTDIRHSVPVGENYLFALGFAVSLHSTLFAQIIHALSKIMLICGVFGAARAFRAGVFSLVTAALIVSEEHILASGANAVVRINMPLTLSVFFIGFGLFTYARTQKKEFLFLSLIAVFDVLTCKYVGVNFLACFLLAAIAWLIFHPDLRQGFKLSLRKNSFSIFVLSMAAVFAVIPYVYNLIATGTPFFPASLGPLTTPYYDKVASDLARDWHFHLKFSDAIKNFSAFMVWPGILSSKILIPLALVSSLFAFLAKRKEERFFSDGMAFFAMSVIIVILTETYVVFEMRYYRYGIGLYALSCTFLLCFLARSIMSGGIWHRFEKGISAVAVILICLYCVRYSFDVMRFNRPTGKEIIAFLTGKESEKDIISRRYANEDKAYQEYRKINPDPEHTGFVLSFGWPQAFYPIEGKNIAFINTGGFRSETYFNEGLFAKALVDADINFVFNQSAKDENYPLPGGAAYHVFQQCGKPVNISDPSMINLSRPCLEALAKTQDHGDASRRLSKGLDWVKSLPIYEPFNTPGYGGPSRVVQ